MFDILNLIFLLLLLLFKHSIAAFTYDIRVYTKFTGEKLVLFYIILLNWDI